MASPKRIRGRRARSHWQRRGHDLRSQYREFDLPATAHVAVTTIEDAYAPVGRVDKAGILHAEAELEPVRHPDGTLSLGQPVWMPPQRPVARVIRSLREDAIGKMHARHQISQPQYAAARGYQEVYERATLGRLSPGDPSRVKVDGGKAPDPISDSRLKAARRLQSVENSLRERYGTAGLELTRAVLVACLSVEKMARTFGAKSALEVRNWGWLFRRCLDCLAVAFGLSNTTARPYRAPRNGNGAPDLRDTSMHAGVAELGDAHLRQGRPNGRSRS